MSSPAAELTRAYSAMLTQYLLSADEAALDRAHDLGRSAMEQGVGMIHLVSAHHQAVAAAQQATTHPLTSDLSLRAGEMLTELLSPFEMMLRGYADANRRLQELNGELEAFSYAVAHDLRAPLRSIEGFSRELLQSQSERLDDEGKDDLRRVRAAAARMGDLIAGLLELSKLSRRELQRSEVDLARVGEEVVTRLRAAAPERKVEVEIAGPILVHGDRRLVEGVLENLLGNAWKFTRNVAQARVELGTRAETGEQVIFVRDNGAGFDMAYAHKLFGPFQRLHTTAQFEGTGIGLATVRRIIARHGGTLWANAAPGKGATFYFTLPGR